jgi:hypothetical protein
MLLAGEVGAHMDTNAEQWEPRWHDELVHLKVEIETLKAQMESGFQELYHQLNTHIATIEKDVRQLETQAASTVFDDPHVSKIEAQIEQLRAQGDAAYDLLQARLGHEPDPVDIYIRRLEAAVAASPSEEIRHQLLTRITQIQGERAVGSGSQQSHSESSSPEG